MDITAIEGLISSLGFPIVCVVGLGWFLYVAFNRFMAQTEKREERITAIIDEAQETNKQLLATNAGFIEVLKTYKTDLDAIKQDVNVIKNKL